MDREKSRDRANMQLHHGIDGLKNLPPGTALSIGNFDGIHCVAAPLLDRHGHTIAAITIATTTATTERQALRSQAARVTAR